MASCGSATSVRSNRTSSSPAAQWLGHSLIQVTLIYLEQCPAPIRSLVAVPSVVRSHLWRLPTGSQRSPIMTCVLDRQPGPGGAFGDLLRVPSTHNHSGFLRGKVDHADLAGPW